MRLQAHNSMIKCFVRSPSMEFTSNWRERTTITVTGFFHNPTAQSDLGQPTDIFGSIANNGNGDSFAILPSDFFARNLVLVCSCNDVTQASLSTASSSSDEANVVQEMLGSVSIQVYVVSATGTRYYLLYSTYCCTYLLPNQVY